MIPHVDITTKIDLIHTPIHHVIYRDISILSTLTLYICSLNGVRSMVMCRETVARSPCNFCNQIWRIER